jgi:hypothetical protein
MPEKPVSGHVAFPWLSTTADRKNDAPARDTLHHNAAKQISADALSRKLALAFRAAQVAHHDNCAIGCVR